MIKIPLLFGRSLKIEKVYATSKVIIPIGYDCHPAYVLAALHLRKFSLPFDWMNSNHLKGMQFVKENIDNNFALFMENMKKSKNGHVVPGAYEYVEFIHEPGLASDPLSREKFKRRIARFLKLYESSPCSYLYNVESVDINNDDEVHEIILSAKNILSVLKNNDTLHFYIRYDETMNENKKYCDHLFTEMKNLPRTYVAKYIRYKQRDGIWGNPKNYVQLLQDLNIPVKVNLIPKISISSK